MALPSKTCRESLSHSSARKTVRSQGIPGVGLGLSVVERIAQVFGGSVIVRSDLRAGSRFQIRLPLVSGASPPSPFLSDR